MNIVTIWFLKDFLLCPEKLTDRLIKFISFNPTNYLAIFLIYIVDSSLMAVSMIQPLNCWAGGFFSHLYKYKG